MNKDVFNKLVDALMVVLTYATIVVFALVFLHNNYPRWEVFVESYFNVRLLRLSLLALGVLTAGGLLCLRFRMVLDWIKTDALRYGFLFFVVVFGISFKLHFVELIIFLYAAYAILFINQSLEKNKFYQAALKGTEHFLGLFLNVESRTPALAALFLFIFIPLLLIFKKIGFAERMAVYAYYFLVITVVLQIAQMKMGIEKKNPFLVLMGNIWRSVSEVNKRKKIFVEFREGAWYCFSKKPVLYFSVMLVLLASLYAAKFAWWKHIAKEAKSHPEYRSEISLLNKKSNYTLPSVAEQIIVPVRIKHPVSYPLLWRNSGKDKVEIGIQWLSESSSGDEDVVWVEEKHPLPKSLFATGLVDTKLILRRPAVPTGRSYLVRVGLVSHGEWWVSARGDSVLEFDVGVENVPFAKSLAHEAIIYNSMRKKVEAEWSLQLSSNDHSYRSKISVLKDDLYSHNRLSVSVKNTGSIPWPVHNQTPVRLGVVWVDKMEKDISGRFIHLAEAKFDLPDVVFPGESQTIDISFDLIEVPDADAILIGMVHEGKAWFYKRGDSVFKLMENANRYEVIQRQKAVVEKKSGKLRKRWKELFSLRPVKKEVSEAALYRSKIRLMDLTPKGTVVPNMGGLSLDLEITNLGEMPWKKAGLNPVNMGVLWFKKTAETQQASAAVLEERFPVPFDILQDTTFFMTSRIGVKIKSGKYEIWISPVTENGIWFFEKGDHPLKLYLEVE